MDLRCQNSAGGPWTTELMLAFVFEEEAADLLAKAGSESSPLPADLLDAAPWLGIAPALRDFKGRKDEQVVVYGHPDLPLPRVLLVGLGKAADLDSEALFLDAMRRATGVGVRRARDLGVENLGIPLSVLPGLAGQRTPLPRLLEEIAFGAVSGLYRYEVLKPTTHSKDADPRWMGFFTTETYFEPHLREAISRGAIAADAVRLARNLINAPANAVTPAFLADEARKIAQRYGFAIDVLDRTAMEKIGMGALLAVAAGGGNDPCCLVLDSDPTNSHEPPLVLVGKGVCFDSGGICLKPAAKISQMKDDMSGAAAVLGMFQALGGLRQIGITTSVPRIVGILPCVENMPDAKATHPGDVVITLAGKTVEIVNTDAEGRLILCDALTYAQRRFKPAALIDIATLTGACVVALGNDVAGLFSDDPLLGERVRGLGARLGEWYWPLPVWDRYFENLKSDTADFANSGAREGGACTAAIFLKQFVEPGVRWAHLDIAGPSFAEKRSESRPAGGQGFGVRTLLELAIQGLPA